MSVLFDGGRGDGIHRGSVDALNAACETGAFFRAVGGFGRRIFTDDTALYGWKRIE